MHSTRRSTVPDDSRATELPKDIVARLGREYAGESYFEALRLVESLSTTPRVARAVVFLARGEFEELALMARAADLDPRDVLFWAEYEDHDAETPRQVRSMEQPFDDDVPEAETRTTLES